MECNVDTATLVTLHSEVNVQKNLPRLIDYLVILFLLAMGDRQLSGTLSEVTQIAAANAAGSKFKMIMAMLQWTIIHISQH